MKKAIAAVGLLLIAIFNNLSPVITGDVAFDPSGCYSGEVHEEVDYQQMYKNYVNSTSVGEDVCKITPRSLYWLGSKFKHPDKLDGHVWLTPEPGRVYQNNKTWIDEENSHLLWEAAASSETAYIILSPKQLTVYTPAESSDHGTTMELIDSQGLHKLRFESMERWYCCMGRSEERSVSTVTYAAITGVQYTHTADAHNTVLNEGDIIGVGNGTTIVSAYKRENVQDTNWSRISLYEFYTGFQPTDD